MRCEVVAIGTELLLGQIVDTNSSWIGEQLALAGIDSLFQVKVGDNAERMEETICHALERSDAVICCGGLGPTQDDITREVIAKIMGVGMQCDDEIAIRIRDMFEARGRVMPDNNLRQADIPTGATPIAQMPGTAPGLICPVGDKVIYAVPGVPFEMREMMEGTVLADLQRRSGQTAVIRSRVVRTWGHGESALAEMLAGRHEELEEQGTATLAFQASGIEGIKVRITAKAENEAAAEEIIAAEEALIRDLLGDVVFGVDDETMESVVLDDLRARGMTLAAAEYLTGGILATRMTVLDPDLQAFRGSLVAVPDLDHEGAEATSMDHKRAATTAQQARAHFGADVGIAALEPGDMEDYPNGTVFVGIAMQGTRKSRAVTLPGARSRMRSYAVISLLDYLRKTLAAEG
jgi:nicotinamide-nucleotide amidase